MSLLPVLEGVACGLLGVLRSMMTMLAIPRVLRAVVTRIKSRMALSPLLAESQVSMRGAVRFAHDKVQRLGLFPWLRLSPQWALERVVDARVHLTGAGWRLAGCMASCSDGRRLRTMAELMAENRRLDPVDR